MILKHVFFDFDGVLVDSFDAVYTINRLAAQHIGRQLTRSQYREFFYGNIHSRISEVLGLSAAELELFTRCKYELHPVHYTQNEVAPYDGTLEFLKKIHRSVYCDILSSSPEKGIRCLLDAFGISGCIRHIYALNAEGKRGILQGALSHSSNQVYFITDTIGDICQAERLPITTIAVSWGFHDAQLLMSARPDHVVSNFSELLDVLLA